MKLKRVTAVLTLSVWIGVLAACGQNEDPGATPRSTAAAPEVTSDTAVPTAAAEPTSESTGPYEVAAEELRAPWVIAFAGNVIYVSEREGNVVQIDGDQWTRQTVNLTKSVHGGGESGFLGFLLAPDFEQSQKAYAYHTYEENGETLNRVVQLKYTGKSWDETRPLLEGIPGAYNHDGGRMAYGPDKLLYITTGDAGQPELSQDQGSLAGKILRMTLDGKVPADNPFPDSYVYSYGHRNPQGLAWTDKGVMLVTEHGPSGSPGGHDEINIIEPGGNYGWPTLYGDQTGSGMIPPVYHTGEPAIAPSGAAIDDQNRMLIATLVGSALYRYDPATKAMSVVFDGEGRLRDVKMKDGRVYVITNNTDGRGNPSKTDDRLLIVNGLK
ncbi:Glucose/arabinose dehydrogenase, beta-propeller fold [Paenibacillus algorifonticola]|uniref:Glucose/arabinose dehydrogenase, beta-propeller fold n=1 Tax=Paenibacillus algorifonticola TaxID=684063 RepID=A0A1I2A887_9BACL|nr:PQQ-dependent sugar dehydrogenase [Paenibacillus algorifonticola]SFE40304.1 Glucose/arabinose dehydrogenase, beta-propeller fold [Paenibacillus algorifonticola]